MEESKKTRHVRIRFEEPLYRFIDTFAMSDGMNISEFIRNYCTMLLVLSNIKARDDVLKSIFSDKKRKESFIKFLNTI
jgi:cell division FtsZ-interacting protein ZapD